MSTVKSFRDLVVWQKSMALAVDVYKLTRAFPREEIYGLTSQLRRATVSVPSNIAEGFGRRSRLDYRNSLCIARGSVLEVQTQLLISRELGFGDAERIAAADGMADEVSRMLWALMEKIGSNKEAIARRP
jgi:four helix bundle protein